MSNDHKAFIQDYIAELSTQKNTSKNHNKKRRLFILVADDDKTVLRKTSQILTKEGHTVRVAPDGLKALAMCLKEPPDLILSDVQMPKMDGWNFLKTIRSRSSLASTLVIFQTSLNSESDRLQGYQLGVDDYISKPYSKKDLLTHIERLIEKADKNTSLKGHGKSLRGDLEQVSIPTVLSLLEMERKTGVMVIVGPGICRIYLNNGRPFSIEMEGTNEDLSIIEMVSKLLTWKTGQFEFGRQDVPDVDKIKMSIQGLLMEAARIDDEIKK